ncbi:hypothetical protein EMIT047CA2_20146 [Pseudomonas soli]
MGYPWERARSRQSKRFRQAILAEIKKAAAIAAANRDVRSRSFKINVGEPGRARKAGGRALRAGQ